MRKYQIEKKRYASLNWLGNYVYTFLFYLSKKMCLGKNKHE